MATRVIARRVKAGLANVDCRTPPLHYIMPIIQELHAAVGSGPARYYVVNKYIIGLATYRRLNPRLGP